MSDHGKEKGILKKQEQEARTGSEEGENRLKKEKPIQYYSIVLTVIKMVKMNKKEIKTGEARAWNLFLSLPLISGN